MRHLNKILVSALFVLAAVVIPSISTSAQGTWKINIATPNNTINSRQFNIEFTTLSTSSTDVIKVDLFQNGVAIDTETTNEPYGDSGDFVVTVPADGTYEYFVRGINGAETKDSEKKVVKVDTVPTAPAGFGQVTRQGNTYTVTFMVPADSDVTEVRLFSSPSSNFTADASTQVSAIAVVPGQQATITYTATDSAQRFHAVQVFDASGNGSTPVGESNVVVVTQALGLANTGIVAVRDAADTQNNDTSNTSGQDGVTQGSKDEDRGQVNADGTSSDKKDSSNDSDSTIAWMIILASLIVILGYANRDKIAKMVKKEK